MLAPTLALGLLLPAPGLLQERTARPAEIEARSLIEAQDFAGALEALEGAVAASGAPAELHRLLAEAHVGRLDYPAAVAALALAPRDAPTLRLEARLLAMLGRDDEARRSLEELQALADRDRAADLEVVSQLRQSGLVEEAGRLLGSPAPDEPLAARLERGRLHAARGDCEGAAPFLEAAATASEAPAGAASELGRCLARLGRRADAAPWLRRAMAEDPSDRAARFRLGQLLLQDEDPDRVFEGQRLLTGYEADRLRERRRALLFAAVLGAAPGNGPADASLGAGMDAADPAIWVQLLGLLLDRADADAGERAEAARILAAASARFGDDPALRIARARLRLAEGRPAAAVEALSGLIPTDGTSLRGASLSAARWLGEAHLRNGAPGEAADLLARVLATLGEGASPRIRSAAATAFAMSGDPDRALAEFDRVLAAAAGVARAGPLTDSAFVLEMLGRGGEAEIRYREALVTDPSHAPAREALADLLRRTGRADEAAALLRPRGG